MRFVGKGFVLAAISLAFILAAWGGSYHARSRAATVVTVKYTVPLHKHHTRFAGFFPPVGARATLPAHGTTLLELPRGNLYADGHIITDRGGPAADAVGGTASLVEDPDNRPGSGPVPPQR